MLYKKDTAGPGSKDGKFANKHSRRAQSLRSADMLIRIWDNQFEPLSEKYAWFASTDSM